MKMIIYLLIILFGIGSIAGAFYLSHNEKMNKVVDLTFPNISGLQLPSMVQENVDETIIRGLTFNNICDGNQCTYTGSIEPINYLNGSEYTPINTTIVPSDDLLYDYEVETGLYSIYYKDNPSTAESVKYQVGNEFFTFQPFSLNYRNALDMIQQVNTIQSVTGYPITHIWESEHEWHHNLDTFLYPNAFGYGVNLTYVYDNVLLKQKIYVTPESLPSPESYIISGGNVTLDIDFMIDYSSNIDIYIDGILWDKKTTKKTSNQVDFKLNGNTIFYLPTPKTCEKFHWVENNHAKECINGEFVFKKQGSKLYVTQKTPYSFLNNTNYLRPFEIDPTISIDVSNTEDDCADLAGTTLYSLNWSDNFDDNSIDATNWTETNQDAGSDTIEQGQILNLTTGSGYAHTGTSIRTIRNLSSTGIWMIDFDWQYVWSGTKAGNDGVYLVKAGTNTRDTTYYNVLTGYVFVIGLGRNCIGLANEGIQLAVQNGTAICTAAQNVIENDSAIFTSGTWYHINVTINFNTGYSEVYVNNVLKGSGTINSTYINLINPLFNAELHVSHYPYTTAKEYDQYDNFTLRTAYSDYTFDNNDETYYLSNSDENEQDIPGIRFLNVSVPQEAVITNSNITLSTWASCVTTGCNTQFFIHNSSNSAVWSSGNRPKDAQKTGNFTWLNVSSNDVANGLYTSRTISLTNQTQEIINMASWSSGNNLSIITNHFSAGSGKNIYFFTTDSATESPVPQLQISYTIGGETYCWSYNSGTGEYYKPDNCICYRPTTTEVSTNLSNWGCVSV